MLTSLHIKNYALIQELDLAPIDGLNIITGETGAGKSIMLGALGLLLGNRADTRVLFDENEKCIIEGTFDIKKSSGLAALFEEEELDFDTTCLIRREISPQNKSRAFINDTPVTLDVLKRIGTRLMDIHSQHETLLLGNSEFQTMILDAVAGNKELLALYSGLFSQYKKISRQLDELTKQAADERKEFDYNTFLLNELREAELQEGEQESLEEELRMLENAESIKSRLQQAMDILENSDFSVISNLQVVLKNLEAVSQYAPALGNLRDRLEGAFIEVKDISGEIESEDAGVEINEERTEEIRKRLSLLYNLMQKHSVREMGELIRIREELESKVRKADSQDEEIEELRAQQADVYARLLEAGNKLSQARHAVKDTLKNELEALLREVGMPNSVLMVNLEKTEPGTSGIDRVGFLFSANKGVAVQELKNVASGGEFSRLMLCIKYILADKTELPVIIFDEIDTGISGEIAIKVGRMLKQMAINHQIISISHLPQIAALGDAHYYVYKKEAAGRSVSSIRTLSQDERLHTIAVMIGGDNPSQTAISSARELMEMA